MLESNILLKNLICIVTNKSNSLMQNLAMDVLYWILSVNLALYRIPKSLTEINSHQSICVEIIERNLNEIIQNCILSSNRSMAKKAVKLIITTQKSARNMIDQKSSLNYEAILKNSILLQIPNIIKIKHAGSLRWFILLIAGTTTNESHGPISVKVMKLLINILNEVSKRTNTLNSLLQSRFGLYGMPFESDLFDTELPSIGRNANNNISYCNVFLHKPIVNGQQQQPIQNQLNDLKNFCSSGILFS